MDSPRARKRKRSRAPGKHSSHGHDSMVATEAQETTRPGKRARKQNPSETALEIGSSSTSTRRSGRIRGLSDGGNLEQKSERQPTKPLKQRKASGSSDKEIEDSRSTGEINTKLKRPGRPQKPRESPVSAQRVNATPASSKQRRRGGLRQTRSLGDSEQAAAGEAGGKRDAGSIPYRKLVTHTRLIALKTMTSKWVPLEQEALAAVQTILADCARPVLSHLGAAKGSNSERRQEQSRLAISATTRRLRSKLAKGIPFPPLAGHVVRISKAAKRSGSTQESGFDFERTLECVKSLEQQLDPLQHSITLLEGQRRREERTLEADYAALRQLETNAQAETRTWRDRSRRLHVLAPTDDKALQPSKFQANVELSKRTDKDCESEIYQDIDKGLSALSAELGSHMESLRSNLLQVQDVVPAIVQSKAVLQQALRRHLSDQQFEHIVLGN